LSCWVLNPTPMTTATRATEPRAVVIDDYTTEPWAVVLAAPVDLLALLASFLLVFPSGLLWLCILGFTFNEIGFWFDRDFFQESNH
jgi:hypothetical protein